MQVYLSLLASQGLPSLSWWEENACKLHCTSRNWIENELTNWIPVSLRIPIPAEAKLAPTSRFSPLSSGLKYGNVGSEPIASPSNIHDRH